MSLEELVQRVSQYQINDEFRDEVVGLRCCELALEALKTGNYGVGAILLDAEGNTLVEEKNQVFAEHFCSSGHAEMRLIDTYEEKFLHNYAVDELKLVVSLEPCPMCLSRLLLSGIGIVKYMVDDPVGGMVNKMDDMPAAWKNLASMQTFFRAHISSELRQLAKDLSQFGLSTLRANLMNERLAEPDHTEFQFTAD